MRIIAILKRFVPPYKWQMGLSILFNLLSTILSLFSFAAIIPVLRILFGLTTTDVHPVLYGLLNDKIALHGTGMVLLWLGLFLIAMTGLKCLTA